MDKIKQRLRAMFMSKEQIIYLITNFFSCIVYGAFGATWAFHNNGLGTRVYSIMTIVGCLCSMVYCWVSADINKKRWVFRHYKGIDIGESLVLTIGDVVFLIIYFCLGFGFVITDQIMPDVLWFFFYYSLFWRIFWVIIQSLIPGVGDVFEQSLYKNQIDYQNHTNAEGLVNTFGMAIGAVASFAVGDYFKYRPWLTMCLFAMDWVSLWARWQFYFKKENFAIIKRNFAKDCGEQRRKQNAERNKTV